MTKGIEVKYRHKKSGNIYSVNSESGVVINCTNAQAAEKMILYKNSDGLTFVREVDEFFEKFEKI